MKKVRRVPVFATKSAEARTTSGLLPSSTVQAMYLPSPGSPTCGPSQGYGVGTGFTETDAVGLPEEVFPFTGTGGVCPWELAALSTVFCVPKLHPVKSGTRVPSTNALRGTPGCADSVIVRGDEVLHIGGLVFRGIAMHRRAAHQRNREG